MAVTYRCFLILEPRGLSGPLHHSFELNVDVLNGKLAVWEPMVEPWVVHVEQKGVQNEHVTVRSDRMLHLNITPMSVELFHALRKRYSMSKHRSAYHSHHQHVPLPLVIPDSRAATSGGARPATGGAVICVLLLCYCPRRIGKELYRGARK